MAISLTLLVSAVGIWQQQTLQVLRPFAGRLTTLITEEFMHLDLVILVYKFVVCGKINEINTQTVNIKVHTEHLSTSQTKTKNYPYTENMAAIWHNSSKLYPSSQRMISTSQI